MAQHLRDAVEQHRARVVGQAAVADRRILQRQVLAQQRQRQLRSAESSRSSAAQARCTSGTPSSSGSGRSG